MLPDLYGPVLVAEMVCRVELILQWGAVHGPGKLEIPKHTPGDQ